MSKTSSTKVRLCNSCKQGFFEERYVGEFLNGLHHGYGRLTFKCVDNYLFFTLYNNKTKHNYSLNGYFKDGLIEDGVLINEQGTCRINPGRTGTIDYNNGDRYIGKLGFVIEGDVNRDNPYISYIEKHGKGKMIFACGDVYEGYWDTGDMTRGVMTSSNGDVCERYSSYGGKVQGKMTYSSGEIREGDWQGGKLVKGKIRHVNGDLFDGEIYDGEIQEGRLISVDGSVYSGRWRNNVKIGKGIFYNRDGDGYDYHGEWIFNDFIVSEKKPTVTSVWRDGVYECSAYEVGRCEVGRCEDELLIDV